MRVITLAFLLIFAIAATHAAPTDISENNLGDIVNVNVNADANIRNEVNARIINVLLQSINMEFRSIPLGEDGRPRPPNYPFENI